MDSAASLPDFLRLAANLFETLPETRQGAPVLRQIAASTAEPFNLAVVGRMKTGKSTLINSLVGRSLAVMGVEETTATINRICYGTGVQTSQFIVHWKDRPEESFPFDRLKHDWTGKKPEVTERAVKTAFLKLFADADTLRERQIIDTPGTGSAEEVHETAALAFLNPDVIAQSIAESGKADAILYVIGAVGLESDVENLELFQGQRLPNSGPYNSVGVVHKWDALQVADPAGEAALKAARLRDQFSGLVADMIPVSGPIALVARSASDEAFGRLLDITALQSTPEMEALLGDSDTWDGEPERANVRKLLSLPWSSFRLVFRQLRDVARGDIAMARQRCLHYSRIEDLEKFINDRFFSQAAIIKKSQALEKAQQIYAPSVRRISAESERLKKDATLATRAAAALPAKEREMSGWLEKKSAAWMDRSKVLFDQALRLDQRWQEHAADLEGLHMDLRVSEMIDRQPDLFPIEDRARIRAVCDHLATPHLRSQLGGQTIITLAELQRLIDFYRAKSNRLQRKFQQIFEHIVHRLEDAFRLIESN